MNRCIGVICKGRFGWLVSGGGKGLRGKEKRPNIKMKMQHKEKG